MARKKIKRGPLSAAEKKKIEQWSASKSVEEIARILSRPKLPIEKHLDSYQEAIPEVCVKRSDADQFRNELYGSPEWKYYHKEMSPDEVVFFEEKYVIYRHDLRESTATELQQVHQLISLEVMMRRHAADSKKNVEDKARLEYLIETYDGGTDEVLVNLNGQLQACRASAGSRTKEYKDLLEKHGALLVHLKSTRDQRIKSLSQQGKIMELLKDLENESKRKAITEISALTDFAIQKEHKRLGQLHKYADSTIDRPLLTNVTIKYEEDEDDQQSE